MKRILVFAVLLLLFGGRIRAQGPATYRPGEVIRVSVTFDGPDASKIVGGRMEVELRTPREPTQDEFQTHFVPTTQKTRPNTFEFSYKVADNQASGEYKLVQIEATVEVGHDAGINFDYGPSDFTALNFKIENPNTVKKPTIKNVTVLPKP